MREKKKAAAFVLLSVLLLLCTGCGFSLKPVKEEAAQGGLENRNTDISSRLSYKESMRLKYAGQFAADYYEDGYVLISVSDGRKYLVVPDGGSVPDDLDQEIIVLRRPLQNIYLAASAVMDMFCSLDAVGSIRFSGQKADGWSMRQAREAMEQGKMLYAGKYDAPDYELIVSQGCSLAIENNMISHSPEAAEKLEDFGIPVLIDLSSYENHPLGRVEWVRLYGVLMEKEDAAKAVFDAQVQAVERAAAKKPSEKTAAFFYITTNGMASVRASSDYIPKMIALAGGAYVFSDLGDEESRRSSVTMQMEDFYLAAKDADFLIYNSTIDGEIASLEELLQKESLLADFKAVREGNVWCTSRDLYQQSMSIGQMTEDMCSMFSQEPDRQKEIRYFYQLK